MDAQILTTSQIKVLGDYPFGAVSLSDPSKAALGFLTEEKALIHAENMNRLIDSFDTNNSTWNKSYWLNKPSKWIVFPNSQV